MSTEPQAARVDTHTERAGSSPRPALPIREREKNDLAGPEVVRIVSKRPVLAPSQAENLRPPPVQAHSPRLTNPSATTDGAEHHASPEPLPEEPAQAVEEPADRLEEDSAAVAASETPSRAATPPSVQEPSAPEAAAPVPGLPAESGADSPESAELEFAAYEEALSDFAEPRIRGGDLCKGQIVSVGGENVIVDYGGKTEGVVPLAELLAAGLSAPAPGQEIEVTVESIGGPGDYAVLSFLKAHRSRVWEQIEKAFNQKDILTAKVISRVKGGLTADIGIPAFLPGSQADIRPVPDLDSLVGQELPVRIVKLSRSRGNVVVSRRALLEEELQERRQQTLAGISEGATVTGAVKSVTNYGAFIDLGGVDGLLHVTDICWGRVRNPAEVLRVGEDITLKVLKFDPQKERVSLSLKHMQPDPWENIELRYREGSLATGSVVSVTDYGAFVELEPGLEGLIHISELGWSKRLKHPSKALKVGQELQALVTQITASDRRISLSLKQLQPDPWSRLSERYPIGQIVQGRVRNLTSYGAFVEIEEGVDGLVHVSDLSWSTRVKHPKDELKKGQQIDAVVLRVDEENRRVSLGVKQLEPDVWEKFFSLHLVGDDVKGQISRFAKFGAFVELAPGVEGLCHNSEMSSNPARLRKPPLRVGQEYEFTIIKLDEFDKKIGLSRRAYELAHAAPSQNGQVSIEPVERPSEEVPSFSDEPA